MQIPRFVARFFLVLLMLVFFIPAALAGLLNINTATQAEFENLPGIGPSKAIAIVAYRDQHGPFKDVRELDNVKGIGPSTLEKLLPLVTVGDTGGATEPTTTPSTTPDPEATESGSTSSSSSHSTAPAPGGKVNINTADTAELMTMPGIGETKATAIIEYRTEKGPFKSCDDLDNVNGIGPSTLTQLRDSCVTQ